MESITSPIEKATDLRLQRQFANAIELFTDYITDCLKKNCSKNDLAAAYNERGFTKYLAVDFDGAVEDYTKAIECCETAVHYYNRALVHYRLARFQQALDDTSRALTLQPDFPDALLCQNQAKIDGGL